MILQKDNVKNQRENVVLTIANAQSRLGIPVEADPVSASLTCCPPSIYVNGILFFMLICIPN
jgi:hypothetical protein